MTRVQTDENVEEEENNRATNVYERAAAEEGTEPAYRAHGKVERKKGSRYGDKTLEKIEKIHDFRASTAKMMKAPDVRRANSLDKINLFFARLAFDINLIVYGIIY